MKNKKIFLRIYIVFVIILTISIIVLSILGKKERLGYLSEFKLNIDRTLEINGLNKEETKQLFTINNEIDNTSITNYIFTNTSITNYSYDFRVKYYTKLFRNSDLYGVYPNLNSLPEYIQSAKMGDDSGTPFGNLVSTKIIDFEKIDNIYYNLAIKIKNIVYFFFIAVLVMIIIYILYNNYKFLLNIFNITLLKILKILSISILLSIITKIEYGILFIIIFILYYFLEKYLIYKKQLNNDDYSFVSKLEIIAILLFIFHLWISFPGYFQFYDSEHALKQGLANSNLDNWHPVIITRFLNFSYNLFGFDSYYILILNLSLWYISLFLIIFSFYIRYRSKKIILLYLITFLADFFFLHINQLKDFTATLLVFFSISIIITTILLNIEDKKFKISTYILSVFILIVGMLWRHNFIVLVYPIFIYLVYDILQYFKFKNIKYYMLCFISYMLIIAFSLILISKFYPVVVNNFNTKIWNTSKRATIHLYLLQIASCAVPNNDGSLIPDEWYNDKKSFDDVKKVYSQYGLHSSHHLYGIGGEERRANSPFKRFGEYPNIKKVWLRYIIRYPLNYISYLYGIGNEIYTINNHWILDKNKVQLQVNHVFNEKEYDLLKHKSIRFNSKQEEIYSLLYNILPRINIFYFILLSIILFLTSGILFLVKKEIRNKILILTFSTSFSSIAIAIIVMLFIPVIEYRYIYPVMPISILSLIEFIIFIYDIGGFKKFIKELRGKDK